ncbi:MAG: RNA polymerase sigma factor [Chloroflexota bacterium]
MTNVLTDILDRPDSKTQMDDDEALALSVWRNPAAFDELYNRHVQRVYRYLAARVGNTDDAQDLTAQTFMAVLEGLTGRRAGYWPSNRFILWVLSIARHKAADHFRRHRQPLPLEAALEVADTAPPPEESVGRQLRLEQVARMLRTLAPDRAEALALRIFGGLSAAEVGQVMGKHESAVKMLVHRAVRDLQQRLAAREIDE